MTVNAKRAPYDSPYRFHSSYPSEVRRVGEVRRALGAGVRGQVDALGRQPVAAGRDLLAPSRAIRLAGEEDAVDDEVLEVEFRAVQRGLGEPVAALLDEDDVSVIERPVRIVEEVPQRVDGAAARSARRREDERVVGVVSSALDHDDRQGECFRGVGLGRTSLGHGEPATRHPVLVLERHVHGTVVLLECLIRLSGRRLLCGCGVRALPGTRIVPARRARQDHRTEERARPDHSVTIATMAVR